LTGEIRGAVLLDQFNNPRTRSCTGDHGGRDLDGMQGEVDVFVAPSGPAARSPASAKCEGEQADVRIVAVEARRAAVLSGGPAAST